MRKLLIILAVVFLTALMATAGVEARSYSSSSSKSTYKKSQKMSLGRHYARGPMSKKMHFRTANRRCKVVCTKKRSMRARRSAPASIARGPVCPAPIVNVPMQPAPVVNVPQQAAPVVNVPAPPPTVGITTDNTNLYIVRENQLMILDKCSFEVKKMIQLQPSSASSQ